MTNKRSILIYISILLVLPCMGICLWLYTVLTPELEVLPSSMTTFGNMVYIFWFILLIIHIILLIGAFISISLFRSSRLILPLSIVFLLLSAILFIWDFILLTDIAKEYIQWDVTEEWMLLFGNQMIHLSASIMALILSKECWKQISLSTAGAADTLFYTVHQTGFICSVIGIIAVVLSQCRIIHITERFSDLWIFYIGLFTVIPFIVVLVCSLFARWKGKEMAAFDEKQLSDVQNGGLKTSLCVFGLLIIFAILLLVTDLSLPLMFWIWIFLFVLLGTYCAFTLHRNQISEKIE